MGIPLPRSVKPLVKPHESGSAAPDPLRLSFGKENPELQVYIKMAMSLPGGEATECFTFFFTVGV